MPARNLFQPVLAARYAGGATTQRRCVQRCSTRIDELVWRIQSEYVQRPELRLTLEEAQDLWQLDRTECEALLTALVDAAFLRRVGGIFMRARSATVAV
jgi:hypothetical protein